MQLEQSLSDNKPNQKALTHIYQKMLSGDPTLTEMMQAKCKSKYEAEFLSWDGNIYTYSW